LVVSTFASLMSRGDKRMGDDPVDKPKGPSAEPGQSQRRETLFSFVRRSDGVPMSIDLLDRGDDGVEVRLLERGVVFASRWFETRLLAQAWSEEQRRALKRS
jgi:hypothetical protein